MKIVTIELSDGNVIEGVVQSEEDSEMTCLDTTNHLLFTVTVSVED